MNLYILYGALGLSIFSILHSIHKNIKNDVDDKNYKMKKKENDFSIYFGFNSAFLFISALLEIDILFVITFAIYCILMVYFWKYIYRKK